VGRKFPKSISKATTKVTGKAFFLNGCDTGARTFTARNFTITTQ